MKRLFIVFSGIIVAFFAVLTASGCNSCSSAPMPSMQPTPQYEPASGSDADAAVSSSDEFWVIDPNAVNVTSTESTTTTTEATSTTTTKDKTTTSTSATTTKTSDTRENAQYVVKPDYKSDYYIVVYAGESQSVAIYSKDENGAYTVLTKCFTCSTGADSSPTRTGQYKIWRRFRWRLLVGNVYGQYSTSISSSYLFHSVPYLKQDPSTLDMAEYDKLGSPASHGCIRLCVRDAKWIYENCPNGTQVNIVNASGPKGAGYPARDTSAIYNGWDPSDPNQANPYLETPTTAATTTITTTTTTTEASAAASTSSSSAVSTTTAAAAEATASSSAIRTTTSTVDATTGTTTTTTIPERWTSQAEMERIVENLENHAKSIGLTWDTTLNESNAFHSDDTRVNTASYDSADSFEKRLSKIISDYFGSGYSSVNIIISSSVNGEYSLICCFA